MEKKLNKTEFKEMLNTENKLGYEKGDTILGIRFSDSERNWTTHEFKDYSKEEINFLLSGDWKSFTQNLSKEELIEKYGEFLTETEIENLNLK